MPGAPARIVTASVAMVAAAVVVAGVAAAQPGDTTTTTSAPPAPTTAGATSTASTTTTPITTTTGSSAVVPSPHEPGVEIDELGGPGDEPVVPGPSAAPLFVGAASSSVAPGASDVVSSVEEFDAVFDDPSPAMAAAVSAYFATGGVSAKVLAVPDESAATLRTAVAGLASPADWGLLVVPALGQLGTADWVAVGTQMLTTSSALDAFALLDLPDEAVASAPADHGAGIGAAVDGLRSAASGSATLTAGALWSSGLRSSTGAPVAAAAAIAGAIDAEGDGATPWVTPGGPDHPLTGLTPQLVVDDALAGVLAQLGVNALRELPGFGTVAMGDLTLSSDSDQTITAVRTLDQIEVAVRTLLADDVFATNDPTTWQAVVGQVSQYLTTLWAAGGLEGTTASDAFTVQVGVPTTMTVQDVLDGRMIVEVTVELADRGMVELTFDQVMGAG